MLCDKCQCEIKTRTTRQNSSLHLYFTLLAEALNEAGYDMKKTIRQDVDIPWTPIMIKEYLWKPLQDVMIKKKSTTRLQTKDIDKIYDVLNRTIGERTGVFVPFPSVESLI